MRVVVKHSRAMFRSVRHVISQLKPDVLSLNRARFGHGQRGKSRNSRTAAKATFGGIFIFILTAVGIVMLIVVEPCPRQGACRMSLPPKTPGRPEWE